MGWVVGALWLAFMYAVSMPFKTQVERDKPPPRKRRTRR